MKAVVKIFILSLTFFFSSSGFSQISGIVFRDYNANGTRQTGSTYNEDGVINVTVKAYNSANIEVGSVVTSSTGSYSFTGLSLPVRIEFIPPLIDDYSGVVGTGSQSSVQFHNATTTTANFGINYPDQYCHTTNPNIITTCFVNGRPAPGTSQTDVIVRHPYSATGNSYGTNNTYLGDAGTVGAVWGVAYNRETGDIFTSALAKRHAAMIDNDGNGVEDLGAIYIKTTAGTPTLWLDLATVPGVDVGLSVMPTISTRGLPNSNMGPSYDSAMFGLVGKIGLGDIEISDDNTTLYVVSLYDKKLYTIDIASKTLIGAGIPVPNPCSGGFARPFSVTYHRGKVYVGTVCDAITSQLESDLKANVYRLDGGSFTNVLSFPLNYVKGAAFEDYDNGTGLHGTKWNPWEDVFSNTQIAAMSTRPLIHPQPILANIEFDHEESMILVFNDRIGHQGGTANFGTSAASTGTTTFNTVASGDILRASLTGGVYVLENNATSGLVTTAGAGNNQGPATINGTMNGYTGTGGEYYHGDFSLQYGSSIYHKDAVSGGSTFYPGSGQVYVHVEDSTDPWSGGSYLLDNTSGAKENAYTIYPATVTDNLFGKANGLGDPELMCNIAPIEIGNRVWVDTDGDGIQDADESPLSGVTIQLVKNGSVIATATTDANGYYVFSSDPNRTSTTSYVYQLNFTPGANYTVRIPNISGGSQQSALTGLFLTLKDQGTDVNDNDGSTVGLNAEVSFVMGTEGQNNHTYDFGFVPFSCPVVSNPGDCANNIISNSTLEGGTLSPTTTYAGSPAHQDPSTISGWSTDPEAYWIDASNSGRSVDGSCKLMVLKSSTAPAGTCLYKTTSTSVSANTCNILCADLAPVPTAGNSSPSTTFSFELYSGGGIYANDVNIISPTTGVTKTNINGQIVAITISIPDDPGMVALNMSGTNYDGTGVLDWSTLDWRKVCIQFSLSQTKNIEWTYSVPFGQSVDIAIDNVLAGACCITCTTPTATVTPTNPSCTGTNAPNNGTLTIVGFTTGQRYQYSTGATFNSGSAIPTSISPIPSGGVIENSLTNTTQQYTVRIYDATDNTCYVDRTVSITAVTPPSVTCAKTDNTNCAAPNGTATATATGVTYLWSNNATTAMITGLAANTYTVTVTST
ncbi:MAG TPA: SdrD B-like domain-containing protein, partial [Saprospiraceae bacterium]|nr:SdrD B-like domain-containing protein [Saprospiraceae bacterium]HMT70611.1 SdrD B-like domain-containing protein [Saprospiraceae bacterium]